jgi:tRNA A-37 threonylcarbamoyl transferase component Bud32
VRGLADYRPLRLLGGGGQALTYLALDTRLARRVVIKLYDLPRIPGARRGAEAEARRLAQLQGPRVTGLLDVVIVAERMALVLAYVPGCNLGEYLAAHGRLPVPAALAVATDVVAGLAAARQQLLVHGDIKAANVLLGRDGRAVLTDFGISVTRGEPASGASDAALTPEHLTGAALTQQSDFFAVGVLLYRMLFGSHPFAAVDGRVDRERLRRANYQPPDANVVPAAARPALLALLRSLLAESPGERPAGTVQLRNRLREVRACVPDVSGLAAAVTALARDDRRERLVPALPQQLVRPPRVQRWTAALVHEWQRATIGARVMIACSAVALLSLPLVYRLQPGPCVEIHPLRARLAPAAAAALPAEAVLERHLVAGLQQRAAPLLTIGQVAGSESRYTVYAQGVRDRCVAQRTLRLELYCSATRCEWELSARGPAGERRVQTRSPVSAGTPGARAAVEELLDRVVPVLMR